MTANFAWSAPPVMDQVNADAGESVSLAASVATAVSPSSTVYVFGSSTEGAAVPAVSPTVAVALADSRLA